ncbi:hypothetical protein [Mycobacterium sp.]|uniref:hypothetical protein n=1 Tax=Mycobacterium sp. TaxID=1785 RepID=UPI002DA88444|nr:hypothetical protein [Mycobacterium sp.]
MGLPKTAAYLIGTWHTADGDIHHFLREVAAYQSGAIISVFSNRGADLLEHKPDAEGQLYRGGISTSFTEGAVRYSSPGEDGFSFSTDVDSAAWSEAGLLDVSGSLIAEPTQWFNPWRNGEGGYAVTLKYRVQGTVFGQSADGFVAVEFHFFPPGRSFMDSPFGCGGREVHWGHMATAFADGTLIDASLAIGTDGWGFALLTDESGNRFATTQIDVRADVRPNGYPERILYRFLGQEWLWQIADRAERADVYDMPGIPLGAEGVLRRVGDNREVVTAMGSIDWWRDGRESTIRPI